METVKENKIDISAVGIIEFGKGLAQRQVANASIVKGEKNPVVVTAAHCVYDFRKKEFYEDIFFTPINLGLKKYRPLAVAIPKDFIEHTYIEYDTCFLVMEEAFNEVKEYDKAALNVRFHLPTGLKYYVCGYPGGTSQFMCTSGVAIRDTYKNSSLQGVACSDKDGLSGGPWIVEVENEVVQNSISILSINSVKGIMWGPYWGECAENAYLTAKYLKSYDSSIELHFFE